MIRISNFKTPIQKKPTKINKYSKLMRLENLSKEKNPLHHSLVIEISKAEVDSVLRAEMDLEYQFQPIKNSQDLRKQRIDSS